MQNTSDNIRTYGRSELAQCYFPSLQQKCAWQKLRRWLPLTFSLSHLLTFPCTRSHPDIRRTWRALTIRSLLPPLSSRLLSPAEASCRQQEALIFA